MLTGVIHRLCISGSSQGKQVRGPTFLDEKHTHAGEGCSFSLRPRQAASICHFQGRTGKKKKKITQTHFQTDAPSKQQATARSIGGCHRVLRTKGRGSLFFFPYGTTASGLCKKSSSFLLLSLTRARTGAVYIANSRGRGRGRRKVNRSPKSKVSWWKKGFKQC